MTNYLPDALNTSTKPSLIKEEERFDEETLSLQAERILYSVAFPMVLKTALELGVIDAIVAAKGVWLSASDIALRLPTKPTNPEAPVLLDRMLVLLASHSILTSRMVKAGEKGQTGNGERLYAAEPVCMYFLNRREGSGSLATLFMVVLSEVYFKSWLVTTTFLAFIQKSTKFFFFFSQTTQIIINPCRSNKPSNILSSQKLIINS